MQCDSDLLRSKIDSDKVDQVKNDDFESLRKFVFAENNAFEEIVNNEGFGSFKTFFSKSNAQQSSAEGKGISEATVGLEAQIVVTTRNAQGVVGKWGFWDIDLGNFRKLGQFSFLNLNFAEKSKNKRKKYKN